MASRSSITGQSAHLGVKTELAKLDVRPDMEQQASRVT